MKAKYTGIDNWLNLFMAFCVSLVFSVATPTHALTLLGGSSIMFLLRRYLYEVK